MDPLAWSVLLLLAGVLLVMIEVFIPSGGMLGFLSIASLMAGIIMAFYHRGPAVGFLFLALTSIIVPVALVFAFRWWPKTPMGRRVLLQVPTSDEVLPDSPERRSLRQLVGKVGVAKSLMLPSGAVIVDGHTIDALSEGVPIEAGQRVRILEVRGNRVLVRADDNPAESTDDVLSQPIESLGLDSLEDPLA
jgi:membrane-bound serine protease (ClpP class)